MWVEAYCSIYLTGNGGLLHSNPLELELELVESYRPRPERLERDQVMENANLVTDTCGNLELTMVQQVLLANCCFFLSGLWDADQVGGKHRYTRACQKMRKYPHVHDPFVQN